MIDGSNYNADSGNNEIALNIYDTNIPLGVPVVSNIRTLADLNAYATPVDLVADDIRAGGDSSNVGTIVGARYNAPGGTTPQIYVQRVLERSFAHLAIWTKGEEPAVITSPTPMASDFDNDFRYAALADNAVSNLPTSGLAIYNFEADATYKGVNFFPDGNLTFNFGAAEVSNLPGGNFRGRMVVQGSSGDEYFGVDARLPGGSSGLFPTGGDRLVIDISNSGGTINTADGSFSGTPTISAAIGFFSDFVVGTTGGTIDGRFYHSSPYNPAVRDPFEIAGSGMITDSASTTNDLHFGFIGSCVIPTVSLCGPGNTNIVTPNIITP